MANTTSRLALTQPVGTDAVSVLRTSIGANATILDAAVTFGQGTLVERPDAALAGRLYYATDTAFFYLDTGTAWDQLVPFGKGPVSFRSASASLTASPGDLILAESGVTITLPSPTADAVITITTDQGTTGASPVTVAGSANIDGIGLNSASSFLLGTSGATVTLQADGTFKWYIVDGQQDTGWVALTLASGFGAASADYAPSARLQGDLVRLKGGIANNTGGNSTSGQTWATVPSPFVPTQTLAFPVALGGTVSSGDAIHISTGTGALTCQTAVGNGLGMTLNGVSYSLS